MSQNNQIVEEIMNENNGISVYVKLALTTQTKNYVVNENWSLTEFIEYIKTNAMEDFLINDVNANTFNETSQETKIEYVVVEAGQHAEGLRDEDAPELTNSDITLQEKYQNLSQIAFYVRPVYVII